MLLRFLRLALREKDIQNLLDSIPEGNSYDSIDEILDRFNFSYQVNSQERNNIPDIGPVVVVANHPIGSLDGLALMQLLHQIRGDIKVLASDILQSLTPLDSLMIPMDYETGKIADKDMTKLASFMKHGLVIIFPAREVSRFRRRDPYWQIEFVKIAKKFQASIVPAHIKGRNSLLFYLTSIFSKRLSKLMLVRETWRMHGRAIKLTIGSPIEYSSYTSLGLDDNDLAAMLRRHLFRIGRGRPGLFPTRPNIALARPRILLARELSDHCEMILQLPNNFSLYLCEDIRGLSLLHEIGRGREHSFRYAGQGSGKRLDIDSYDEYYHHLILWNSATQTIVGAYRFLACNYDMINSDRPMYTSGTYHFDPKMREYIDHSIELGRSYVLPLFWGTRALEYLWAGIVIYLDRNPGLKYLFGSVSFTAMHNPALVALLVQHYSHYYRAPFYPEQWVRHVKEYNYKDYLSSDLTQDLPTGDESSDMRYIKRIFSQAGITIPPLMRHYSNLCQDTGDSNRGVSFPAFGQDSDFSDCIDGFLMVEFSKISPQKLEHYASLRNENEGR